MEIVFVWIDKFRNLEKAGFNLGSEYNYELEIDETNRACKLTRTHNENFIPDFFKPFSNISAIVGENASGKSSFIDALRQILHERRDYFEYFVLFNDNNRLCYEYYLGSEKVDESKRILPFSSANRSIDFTVSPSAFQIERLVRRTENQTIFFSQIIDMNIYPLNNETPIDVDISSNWLSFNDIKKSSDASLPYYPLAYHKYCETFRQLEFVNSWDLSKLNKSINLPTVVDIFSFAKSQYLSTNNEYWDTNTSLEKFDNKILENIKKRIEETKSNKEKVFLYFLKDVIKCVYRNFEQSNSHRSTTVKVTTNIQIIEQLQPYEAMKEFLENQDLFNGKAVIDFIDIIKQSIDESDEFSTEFHASWTIKNTGKLKDILIKTRNFLIAISKFSAYSDPFEVISFDWRNMSTGEKAYLNLFSRFYYAKKQILQKLEEPTFKGKENKLPNIIYILIDEGEIGFHLQWQKEYISKLHNVLPEILKFEGHDVKLQLIFTTHSPISLSDMPNDRVIYLKDGKVMKDRRKTFGANISDLFADSFFFSNGLIGDFAKSRINKTIDWLRNSKDPSDSEYHKNVIANIDEPTIQRKLAEMYSDKMKMNLTKELEKKQINNQIEKLKEDFKSKYKEDL